MLSNIEKRSRSFSAPNDSEIDTDFELSKGITNKNVIINKCVSTSPNTGKEETSFEVDNSLITISSNTHTIKNLR